MDIDKKNSLRAKVVAFAIVIIFCVVPLLIFLFSEIFKRDSHDNEIRIDNFSSVFNDVPDDTKYSVFVSLYYIVSENIGEDNMGQIPTSGALIREGSWENKYDKEENLYTGTFIVDIDSIEQSYSGYFKWSDDDKNQYMFGNYISFDCVDEKDKKYESFVCSSIFSDYPSSKFPIVKELPISVEYFSSDYSYYVKYFIGYDISDDGQNITLKIKDYTGDNYERALTRIRKLGFDPSDYEIEYIIIDDDIME